ncbi:CBO0543 family protein [Anaerosolibacter sp.]|uniref:CBO0543 family protein n=1 Tax=Anaerosolibacter sp. TaxID=1872527 RepID=UPI0039EF4FCC
MYLLFVVFVWLIFGLLFVDWKNWKPYYPTILYYCTLNLLYDFLYFNHTLFAFQAITTKYLNHTIIELAFLFIIMPIVILIFLQRYPEQSRSRVIYICIWSLFFWIIEYLFAEKNMFIYDNAWNVWHSAWFDVLMFIMFRLHYKRPALTIGLSVIVVILFIFIFPVPLSKLK